MWVSLIFTSRFRNEAPGHRNRWQIMLGSQSVLAAWPASLSIKDCCPCSCPSCCDSPNDWTDRLSLSCMYMTSRTEFPSHAFILYKIYTIVSPLKSFKGRSDSLEGREQTSQLSRRLLVLRCLGAWWHLEVTAEVILGCFIHSLGKWLLRIYCVPGPILRWWIKLTVSLPHGAYIPVISQGTASDPHCLHALLVVVLNKKAHVPWHRTL